VVARYEDESHSGCECEHLLVMPLVMIGNMLDPEHLFVQMLVKKLRDFLECFLCFRSIIVKQELSV
jgi:hypothetical protein